MKNTKIDQGDLRSIIVNNYDMVLMLMVEEIVVSLTEKMVATTGEHDVGPWYD